MAEKKTARQVGTTVTVKNLFSNLPVRSKEFSRNIRKEYGKLISLLNAYALIAKGVRLVCTNTTGKNVKSVVLKTQGSGSLKDNIITLFGISIFNCLEPLSLRISDSCKVEGFLSKPGQGSGRNLGDRQFFFVNSRPVDMPKVTKLVNELYRGSNSQQHPIAIMNFTVPTGACDVNVTPDKRKVFFSDESSILQARYSVNKVEEPIDLETSELCSPEQKSYTALKPLSKNKTVHEEVHNEECVTADDITVKTVGDGAEDIYDVERLAFCSKTRDFALRVHGIKKADDSTQLTTHVDGISAGRRALPLPKIVENGTASNKDSSSCSSSIQTLLNRYITVSKRKHENIGMLLSEMPVLRNQTHQSQSKNSNSDMNAAVSRSPVNLHEFDHSSEADEREASKYLKADMTFNRIVNPLSSGGRTNGGESLEDINEDKEVPRANVTTTASSSRDLGSVSEVISVQAPLHSSGQELDVSEGVLVQDSLHSSGELLDAPKRSAALEICSTLQFSFQDLKKRR